MCAHVNFYRFVVFFHGLLCVQCALIDGDYKHKHVKLMHEYLLFTVAGFYGDSFCVIFLFGVLRWVFLDGFLWNQNLSSLQWRKESLFYWFFK
jgi:hypothetical protein